MDLMPTKEIERRIRTHSNNGIWFMVIAIICMGAHLLFENIGFLIYAAIMIILMVASGLSVILYRVHLELRIRKDGKNGI